MHPLIVTSLLLLTPAFGQDEPHAEIASRLGDAPSFDAAALQALGRELVVDDERAGTIWAAGPTWKASFGPDGFTYIPFLGSDAPRNYPVRLALESVTVDGEPLDRYGNVQATRSTDRSITIDHGPLLEVFHLTEDSVEQTFVFDSVPRAGDIVVRMSIDSELALAPDGAGFVFSGEYGGVHYGAATGIAANGTRMPLQQRLVDGGLEIRVRSEALTLDAFPFVVDPIVTTLGVTADSRDQVDVDVAYDGTSGVYMIVYEEIQSAVDHDVRTVFYNANLSLLTSPSSIDISSEHWIEPRVASSYEDSEFLCVATRGNLVGLRDIWGRTRDAHTGSRGAPFAISSFPGDNRHAEVGGYGGSINTSFPYFVVWENYLSIVDDHDIYGQGVGVGGVLQGPLRPIADSPTDDDCNPSISRSSGSPFQPTPEQQYLVGWERQLAPGDRDIWTRVVDYNGSLAGHDPWRSYSFGDTRNVAVSTQASLMPAPFNGPYYVLAFERLRSGIYELFTVVTREGNPDNARSVTVMQDIAVGRHHSEPRIGQDGTGDYLIAYRSQTTGGDNAYVTTVNVVRDGSELRTAVAERRVSLSHSPGRAGAIALGSSYDGGDLSFTPYSMALLTSPGAGGDDEVTATILDETSASVDGSQFCEANDNASGNSAWIRASGSSNSPGGSLTIRVEDLPANAFGYVIASLDAGVTTNAGGSAGNLCLTGAIGRFDNQVMHSGPAGAVQVPLNLLWVPQPSGSVAVMAGERWKFQYWTRDVQGGSTTSNFSNAVIVDFR